MRHAGSGSEGFRSRVNKLRINRIEQDAEADLLAVMFFADVRFSLNKKGLKKLKITPAGAGSLAPPFHSE